MMPCHDCTECDGRGGIRTAEPGEPSTWVRCEACEASGRITSCRCCYDPMPVPEFDRQHGRCMTCLVEGEREDREAHVEQLRRLA